MLEDHIIAGPTLTEDSFVDRLRAVSSPALSESRYIYRTLVAGGVNPAFSLGTFHAESHSGTRGYATYTKNWGNILYYAWTADFGATPYAPGNGYTYAKFPTWLASVRAYVDLLQRYDRSGYTTVSSASAHWLGTIEGSDPPPDVPQQHHGGDEHPSGRWCPRHDGPLRRHVQPRERPRELCREGQPCSHGLPDRKEAWSDRRLVVPDDDVEEHDAHARQRLVDHRRSGHRRRRQLVCLEIRARVRRLERAGDDRAEGLVRGRPLGRRSVQRLVVRHRQRRVTRYQYRTRSRPDGTPSSATSTTGQERHVLAAGRQLGSPGAGGRSVNNASPWQIISVLVHGTTAPFAFSSGTVRHTATTTYRARSPRTGRPGSTLSFTTDDGDALYVIGRVGPAYGRMRITVDGVSTIVDTGFYAASARRRSATASSSTARRSPPGHTR
jgi:hypothetical protein